MPCQDDKTWPERGNVMPVSPTFLFLSLAPWFSFLMNQFFLKRHLSVLGGDN